MKLIKTALKETYIFGTTNTALQNGVSIFWNIYYYKDNLVMVNKSVNEFYNQFLFKIDALTQDVVLPSEISATLFNKMSTEVR